MKSFLGAVLFCLLAINSTAQEGIPVKVLSGSGPPDPTIAHVLGTHYIDISTGNSWICTATTLTATLSQCTWTQPVASFKGPNPWYDVTAYGAKGDGVADDTAAIQSVLNLVNKGAALQLKGVSIFFPQGVYKITNTLFYEGNLSSGIHF